MRGPAYAADNRRPPIQSLRILVADDEPLFLKALERVLARRGHEVVTVTDANQAIERLRAETFDAVLVDHRMPGNGTTVIAHLEDTAFEGITVLMTGGHTAEAEGMRESVHRLQKPFPFPAVIPLLEGAAPPA